MTGANIHISRRQVLKYALLPGIIPGIQKLAYISLFNLAYLIVLIFSAARILPRNHPYLLAENHGRYGIRHVMAEGANHLVVSIRNVDQIVIFFSVFLGIFLFFAQLVTLILAVAARPAFAALPAAYGGYFSIPDPTRDLAFKMLDMTFGVPGVFNSGEDIPTSFHNALHSLLEFYNLGLLIVGIFILIYFTIAVVAETAQSGTPFGKRFNHVWAPVRLVVFFALLIPLGTGLSGAQMVTLWVAKYGSGFASNGWRVFNEAVNDTYLGSQANLVALPNSPEITHIPAFMMVAKTCAWAEGRRNRRDVRAWLVNAKGADGSIELTSGTTHSSAREFFKNGNITIRFGVKNDQEYKEHKGNVFPNCGEISLQTTSATEPGPPIIQAAYFDILKCLWNGSGGASGGCTDYDIDLYAQNYTFRYIKVPPTNPEAELPTSEYKEAVTKAIQGRIDAAIAEGVGEQIDSGQWERNMEVVALGWAGAGIWYNKIAQQNGALMAAAQATPKPMYYPVVMEKIQKEKIKQDKDVPSSDRFSPKMSNGIFVRLPSPGDQEIGFALNEVFKFWEEDGYRPGSTHGGVSGNIFIDTVNAVFGTEGLFNMCRNTDVHPLAQLSGIGKSLLDKAIQHLGASIAIGIGGGLGSLLEPQIGPAAKSAASFFSTIAMIGLSIGFLLFYVIPFLPFLYFFFAAGEWIKSIFEAMAGAPLWALAHIRIDGQGLPGSAAANGYFLLFEIFIRPILIVVGLVGAVSIFAALVKVLNEIYTLVTSNLSGFDSEAAGACRMGPASISVQGSPEFFRGPVDEFFFTVIYAIIVYMMGVSCFKLIEIIPDKIMRWMSSGVPTFGAKVADSLEGVVQKTSIGAVGITGQLKSSVGNLGDAATNAAKGFKNLADKLQDQPKQ